MGWYDGEDPQEGFNLHRRLVVARKLPRDSSGELLGMLTAANTAYTTVNESNMMGVIDHGATLGAEAWWLDAGWFAGGFPWGVGNWRLPLMESVNASRFPSGLRPLTARGQVDGTKAGRQGLKSIVWVEPERVSAGSYIATQLPEYVLCAPPAGLLPKFYKQT